MSTFHGQCSSCLVLNVRGNRASDAKVFLETQVLVAQIEPGENCSACSHSRGNILITTSRADIEKEVENRWCKPSRERT